MDNPKVILRNTRKFGRAVFAAKPIRKGELIAAYDGPFYDNDFDDWNDDLLAHTIQCGRSLWRDSKGLARYINHSCEPNCGIKGRFRVVAMRDIAVGEQITWDYEMTEKSSWWRMRCRCGSEKCRKIIGSYSRMPKAIRLKYKGYISSWLSPKK